MILAYHSGQTAANVSAGVQIWLDLTAITGATGNGKTTGILGYSAIEDRITIPGIARIATATGPTSATNREKVRLRWRFLGRRSRNAYVEVELLFAHA